MKRLVLILSIVFVVVSCRNQDSPDNSRNAESTDAPSPRVQSSNLAEPPIPSDPDTILVKGDDFTITAQQVADYIKLRAEVDAPGDSKTQPNYGDYLKQLVDEELIVQAATKQGLDQEPATIAQVTQFLDNAMLDRFYELEVSSKAVVTQAEIEAEALTLSERDQRAKDPQALATRKAVAARQRTLMSNLLDSLQQSYPINYNEAGLELMLLKVHETLNRLLQADPPKTFIASITDFALTEQESAQPIATIAGTTEFPMLKALTFYLEIVPPRRPSLKTQTDAKRFTTEALKRPIMLMEARRRGYDRDPLVLTQYQANSRRYLVSLMTQRHVISAIKGLLTEEQKREYYEANLDKFMVSSETNPHTRVPMSYEDAEMSIEYELSLPLKEKLDAEWRQQLRKDRRIEFLNRE